VRTLRFLITGGGEPGVKLACAHLLGRSIKNTTESAAAGDKNVSERPQHLGNFIVVGL
jgi:hypothetical protein